VLKPSHFDAPNTTIRANSKAPTATWAGVLATRAVTSGSNDGDWRPTRRSRSESSGAVDMRAILPEGRAGSSVVSADSPVPARAVSVCSNRATPRLASSNRGGLELPFASVVRLSAVGRLLVLSAWLVGGA
jgi:hypothetical protein